MMVVLSREQAAEVEILSRDLDLTVEEVVRHLLSEPLGRWERMEVVTAPKVA